MTATRIALVTGAGTGIGRAACIALSEVGWTIVATGRRLEPLNRNLGHGLGPRHRPSGGDR